ncbi:MULTISPECIES: LexA family protein [Halomonas]|uniref:LexA family protein n=2 Tax=Halomonadaceae TaxID=28256 RepID=UPI0015574EB2|nr:MULTISPECIES: S24 family peptidase [Halomonas]
MNISMSAPTHAGSTVLSSASCAPKGIQSARAFKTAPRRTRHNTYALKIRGNRMRDCNLFDGDVIIIRRFQCDTHEETAVAHINQQPVALKQLSISRFGVHLWPADTQAPDLFLHNRDIQVLGMVMGVAQDSANDLAANSYGLMEH